MLLVELLIFLWLKRAETIRLLPLLLPLAVVVQVAMPGTLGTFRAILFPGERPGRRAVDGRGHRRRARGRPRAEPAASGLGRPMFGQGFGTRLVSPNDTVQNARILDDEWLGQLLELGAVGFLALMWLYIRTVQAPRAARETRRQRGGLAGGGARGGDRAYALGMLTYDAFSFTQVTFLAFVLIGISGVATRLTAQASAPGLRAP